MNLDVLAAPASLERCTPQTWPAEGKILKSEILLDLELQSIERIKKMSHAHIFI